MITKKNSLQITSTYVATPEKKPLKELCERRYVAEVCKSHCNVKTWSYTAGSGLTVTNRTIEGAYNCTPAPFNPLASNSMSAYNAPFSSFYTF